MYQFKIGVCMGGIGVCVCVCVGGASKNSSEIVCGGGVLKDSFVFKGGGGKFF